MRFHVLMVKTLSNLTFLLLAKCNLLRLVLFLFVIRLESLDRIRDDGLFVMIGLEIEFCWGLMGLERFSIRKRVKV